MIDGEIEEKHLVAEGVKELDGVDLQDGMYIANRSLQIRKDVVREELDDVDERVGGCDTVLYSRSADYAEASD